MELNPDFPIVSGAFAMPNNWTLTLPVECNRRVEDGSLVLWTHDLTLWINIWQNDANLSMQEQAERILAQASAARREQNIERSDTLLRLTYELAEQDSEQPTTEQRAISGHVISPAGYVQIAAYFDTPEARTVGYQVIGSVRQK
ncbi:MAG: hypothetical protein V4484_23935 [Pseudomonadota bacterium]